MKRQERWWARICARITAAGKHCRADVRAGDPAEEILEVAEERQADVIVAGARGRSLIERRLVGNVSDRLLKHAASSVLIVR